VTLEGALHERFGAGAPAVSAGAAAEAALAGPARRASVRRYRAGAPVDGELLRLLCAIALSAPTKSDLQQRDIVILESPEQRRRITALLDEPWIEAAPAFLVFCGNNRRQRQISAWRGRPFANDHLDAFFNATVDAAIALGAFVAAAESIGLGCCPISAIRDHARAVTEILELPAHVFPVAGMTVGRPAAEAPLTPRLPLDVTLHRDRFDEAQVRERIEAYDRRRAALRPYAHQRDVEVYGPTADYGWSEDKARQYAVPLRTDFGAYVREQGFDLL
jgi:nitroreductase/FMN reductase [NAD(P)H]